MRGKNTMRIERARELRKRQTETEAKLWTLLRARQLGNYNFRRQHPIGPYVVDFVCLEQRLVIELDGGQHLHQQTYDAERTKWLHSEGYKVLRFWDNQVFKNLDGIGQAILLALQETSPSP